MDLAQKAHLGFGGEVVSERDGGFHPQELHKYLSWSAHNGYDNKVRPRASQKGPLF